VKILLELFSIAGKIQLENADKVDKDLDKIDKKAGGLASKLGNFAKGVGKAGAIIGGAMVAGGAAVGAMAAPMVKAAADMEALNSQFDQVFGDMSKNATKSMEAIAKETGMLPNRIKGSFVQMSAFAKTTGMDTADALALTERATLAAADSAAFYDRSIESTTETLQSFLKGNYENDAALGISATETTRNAAANKLYGKSFKDLSESQKQLTLLQMVEEGNKLSGALGQAARESDGFENVMGNLKQSWTDLMVKFGQPLLEPVIGWIQKLTEWLSQVNFQPMIDGFSFMVDMVAQGIGTAVQWLGQLIGWFRNLFTSNQETFNGIWTTIQTVFMNIWTYIQEIWTMLVAFWQENGAFILEYAKTVFQGIWDTVSTVFNEVWGVIQHIMGLVQPYIQEVLGKIQTFWAENGEQIMSAVKNAFEFIQGIIEFIMPIITKVIEFAWGLVKNIIDGALNVIMGLVKVFTGVFTGDWKKVWEGVKQIVGGIFDTIKNIFGNIFSAISNIMGNIVDKIKSTFTNVVDFLFGLRKTFLDAGKGLIEQLIQGIKNMAKKVTDTVKGIAKKIRDFLPFSPAKVGPLSDLDKLDFEGPISDSIRKGERGIQKGMADLLNMAEPSIGMNVGSRGVAPTSTVHQTNVTMGSVESLLVELIQAVKQNKDVIISDSMLTDAVNTRNAINEVGRVFG
jgi:phage-related protein